MKQKRVLRFDFMYSTQTGVKRLALIISCLVLPILSGMCPDSAEETVFSFSSIDCSLSVPLSENRSGQTLSEKDFPEEEGVRFETTGPLRLTGKENSQETSFRKGHCGAAFPTADRTGLFRVLRRRQSRAHPFSFQTIQTATLPARAGPLSRLIQDG